MVHTRPAELTDIEVRGNCGRISLSLWDCLIIVSVGGVCLCSLQIISLSNVKSGMKRGDPVLSKCQNVKKKLIKSLLKLNLKKL